MIFIEFDQIKIFEKLTNLFNLVKHLAFFLSGALFYMLHKNKENLVYIFLLLCSFMLVNYSLALPEFVAAALAAAFFGDHMIFQPSQIAANGAQ